MNSLRSAVLLPVALLALLLSACSDAEDLYANMRAFWRFDAVTAAHPLYTALNSPGMFCKVTIKNSTFYFEDADGIQASYPTLSSEAYGKTNWVAGLLVGTPSVPDLNGSMQLVAYDLVCASCYEETSVQRSLKFTDTNHEQAVCNTCKRIYDLANGGKIIEGNKGKKLYRYHISYSPSGAGTVVVNN